MSLIDTIIMGLVQGLAEFLPVSSSGHLAIMKHILGINTDTGLLYDVLLHFGTLAAVFVVFWNDIKSLIIEGFKLLGDFFINIGRYISNLSKKDKIAYKKVISTPYRRFVLLVILSTIPTGIIGYAFKDVVETAGETLLVPGLSLILTSILLTIADRIKAGKKTEADTGYIDSIIIGVSQGIAAILPGLSRSGTTITTGLLRGLDRSFAVKYSFIMSIPAILGATVLELKDFTLDTLDRSELVGYVIGTLVAAIVGYIAIKTMLVIVRGKKFKYFAYYCFLAGSIAIVCHFVL